MTDLPSRHLRRLPAFATFVVLLLLAFASAALQAQNTCYTDKNGVTICSTPDTVINGNTNSSGTSVYRDDRGNQLPFETDSRGTAVVQPRSGEPIQWNQPALGTLKYPAGSTPVSPGRPLPPVKPIVGPGGSPIPPR